MICKYRDAFFIYFNLANYIIKNKCSCINLPSNLINIQQSIVALKEWSNVLITFLNWVHELLKRCTSTEYFLNQAHNSLFENSVCVWSLNGEVCRVLLWSFINKYKMMIYCNTCFLLWHLDIVFLSIWNKIYITTNKCH